MKKSSRYVLLVCYLVFFYITQRVSDFDWFRTPMFLLLFFLFVPFLLMFLEKIGTDKSTIKTSLWYGIMVLVTDLLMRNILVIGEKIVRVNVWDSENFNYSITYTVWDMLIDIITGLVVAFVWLLVVVLVIYLIGRLRKLNAKFKPGLEKTIVYTGFMFVGFIVLQQLVWLFYTELYDIQAQVLFVFPVISIVQMFVVYFLIVLIVTIVHYVRDSKVDIDRTFHLGFVIYLGILGFSFLFVYNPLFWELVYFLIKLANTSIAFSFFFVTIIGIYLTVITYFISRSNDDVSKDVIFMYKAMVVLMYGFYFIFSLFSY